MSFDHFGFGRGVPVVEGRPQTPEMVRSTAPSGRRRLVESDERVYNEAR